MCVKNFGGCRDTCTVHHTAELRTRLLRPSYCAFDSVIYVCVFRDVSLEELDALAVFGGEFRILAQVKDG